MSKRLEVRLFGTISIELDGIPVTGLGTRKAEALLVYLVSQKRPFSREVLADLLWDDRPQKQALANLRSLLSGLKKQLTPFLIIERHTVSFNHESVYWLDTAAFSELLKIEKQRLESNTQSSIFNLQSLEKAADLYQGDFLEGFYLRDCRGFEEWASLERERLRQLGDRALRELVRYHLEQGSYTEGNRFADQLLKFNNLSEVANRYKMLLLARSGRRNAALKQYESYQQLLAVELGVEPTAETTAVYERIRAFQSNQLHNLPPQATPFVGRKQELGDFQQQLLDPNCRLLTLLGPGGMGKTRLALAAVERIVQQQPGLFLSGIRFVPLANIPNPDLLATAVADACAITLQGQETPLQQIVSALQDKEMLLVLDNLEHLFGEHANRPDAVDMLQEMLHEAPLLQILVTSRERLNLQEEWVFDLDGLDYPPEAPERDIESYSAVQLFLQNAQRIQRHFSPTTDDWHAMAQVCRLLRGMPLGIELAAAWTRQFSCAAIAEQIQTDIDFLSTKLRNVPARHRSITAVFEYSWALLSAQEQTVFARLSVFRGSFSTEAALAVAEAAPEQLAEFAGKSLLRDVENGRYALHELLRQFAAEKLNHTEDAEKTHQRHMITYLEQLSAQGSGEKHEERQAIQIDLANIRQAWQEAARQQAHTLLANSTMPFHGYFSIQSKFQEGINLFQYALEQLTQDHPIPLERAPIVCELWGRMARMQIHIGQLEAAKQALDQAMLLLPLVEDPERHSVILSYAAITTFYAGDFARASEMMAEGLHLSESIGDQDGIAFAYNFLGSCAKALGDYEQAETNFTQAVTMYQQLEDELGAAMAMNNLGNAAQAKGDFAAAQAHYLACSKLFKALDHTHGAATTLANAGRLALKQAQYDDAHNLLAESLTLKRAQKDDRGTAVALVGLGGVYLATEAFTQAQQTLCEAIQLAHTCGDIKLTLECLVALAQLGIILGQPQETITLLTFTINHQATTQEVKDNAERLLAALISEIDANTYAQATKTAQQLDLETALARGATLCSTNNQ